jgi:UPF0755 protein
VSGKKLNNTIRNIAAAISLLLFLIIYTIFWKGNHFAEPAKFITVSKGESFSSVADSLQARGIISSSVTFKIAGRFLGVTQKMRIGKYSFVSGLSNTEILNDIKGGISTIYSKVTIFEGARVKQIAKILRREVGIDSARFLSYMNDTSLIGIYPNRSRSLEGYLLPDTYDFFWQDDEKEIIKRLIKEFREFYVDSLQQRAKAMKISLNEVLTMASIVEGEAVYDDERPIIAGVYYNRLKKRMRLQADPTVQYAISDIPKRLSRNDLKIDSPYNTYEHYGLPPGPINNPGRKSILAALYPAKHQYLYFVSNYNGRHRFSRTYEEHQRYVREYRKARARASGR